MVMTSRVSPRAYSMGVFAIPVLFLAAWVSMPAHSAACPTEQEGNVEGVQLISVPSAKSGAGGLVMTTGHHRIETDEIVVADGDAEIIHIVPADAQQGNGVVLAVSNQDGHSHTRSAHGRVGAAVSSSRGRGDRETDERLARLERQMAELSEKLSVLIEQRSARRAPQVPQPPRFTPRATTVAPVAPVPPAAGLSRAGFLPGPIVVRTYELHGQKLNALTRLMSRSDVPTRVRAVRGGIEVHASEADQAKFAAFVEMISGEGLDDTRSYRLSKGKLEALTELMALDDVPVLIHYGDDDIKVQGGGLIQKTFREFVEMIEPSNADRRMGARTGVGVGAGGGSHAVYDAAVAQAQAGALRAREQAESARRRAMIEVRAARLHEAEAQAAMLEAKADDIEAVLDRHRDQIGELEERLDDEADGADARALREKIAAMEAVIRGLEAQLEGVYRQIEITESQVDEIEDVIQEEDDA